MQAVIFDIDGTLIDTRGGIFWQYEQLTREFDGVPASREAIAAALHGTLDTIVPTLVKNREAPREQIFQRLNELWLESDRMHALYPGAAELLAILQRLDVRLGVVTSGDERTVALLQRLGVGDHFEVFISKADYALPKPNPEGLLLALQKLGAAPHEAAMVGDTPADIQAGKNAGVAKTIAVTHGFGTLEALQAAAPNHIVHDLPSLLDVVE